MIVLLIVLLIVLFIVLFKILMKLFTLFLDHPEDARPEYGGLHTESIPGSVHKVALAAFAGKVIVLLDELA